MPFVRIDHVPTGAQLTLTGIVPEPGFGSDHRFLVATGCGSTVTCQGRTSLAWF